MSARAIDNADGETLIAAAELDRRGWVRVEPGGVSPTDEGQVAFMRAMARIEVCSAFARSWMADHEAAGVGAMVLMMWADSAELLDEIDAAFMTGPLSEPERGRLIALLAEGLASVDLEDEASFGRVDAELRRRAPGL